MDNGRKLLYFLFFILFIIPCSAGAQLITTVAGNVLQNNDVIAGIPLISRDGYFYSGAPGGLAAPQAVTYVGLSTELNVFIDVSAGGNNGKSFVTNNGAVSSLNGSAYRNRTGGTPSVSTCACCRT